MSWIRSRSALWATIGVLALALFVSRCAPSAPKGGAKKAAAGSSDIAVAAQKTYVAPGDLDEYYLFSSGGHSGQIYVYGVPVDAPPVDDSGLHALPRDGLRLRRRHQEDAGEPDLGRRASPGALGDQRRLRRPVALRERDERAGCADRPAGLQNQADPRADPERVGKPRVGFRHAQQRILRHGVTLLDPDPEGDGDRSGQVRHRLQGGHHGRQDRSEERRDVLRLAGPDAALQLRPWRRRQEGVRRLRVLHVVQHRAGDRQARSDLHAARPRLHRDGGLEAGREVRRARARAPSSAA